MSTAHDPVPVAPESVSANPRAFDVTHRGVFAIAVPMTLAYLSTPILGIVDTTVIGRLGDAALLGGIAVGAIIFDLIFTTFNCLRSSTTGLTAQALGAGNDTEMRATLYRSVIIALICGVAVVALQVPILAASLWFMGASDAVSDATSQYFSIRVLGTPFGLVNYAILGWFLGLGRAGTGLALQGVLNLLNIILNVFFVMGLGWGIAGVAWGTVIGEATIALIGTVLVWRELGGEWRIHRVVLLNAERLLATVLVNRDIMIRSFSLLFAFWLFTAAGARNGDVILGANAVLMNFFLLGGYFLDGFATAAEQFAGRAVGARHRPAFERAVNLTVLWGFILAGILTTLLFVFGGAFIDLMTTNETVRETARTYLIWATLTPVVGVLAFQFDGVFIGATWSDDMRNMMLLSLAIYVALWKVAEPAFGNHGLWLALNGFLAARGVLLLWRYRRRIARAFPDALAERPAGPVGNA
ncbi:MAG: MATE family efflux transporter [Rhodobiaceae bacterium]|nr:MATE family efflux transporter [Rhodobiaceae bacterium]MCC0051641.1 MATE family efflux transporter [Rhodobiaceae bacterium]MCC0061948.1 MATE family efflux transporter [Rhodobiaceae bacterium]